MINKNEIDCLRIIKKSVNELLPDSRVILFGSRARKENSASSDYDFLVITKNVLDVLKKRSCKAVLRKRLAEHKIPADILIESENEIAIKECLSGHIVKTAIKEGVAL